MTLDLGFEPAESSEDQREHQRGACTEQKQNDARHLQIAKCGGNNPDCHHPADHGAGAISRRDDRGFTAYRT